MRGHVVRAPWLLALGALLLLVAAYPTFPISTLQGVS